MYIRRMIIIVIIMTMIGCIRATQTLYLYDGKDYAEIITSKNISIVKIDEKLVKVKHEGEKGTEYSKVTIKPGHHTIAVHVEIFNEGSIVLLDTYVVAGKEYLVKFMVGDRVSWLSSKWHGKTWIEDSSSGEIVSKFIRNF